MIVRLILKEAIDSLLSQSVNVDIYICQDGPLPDDLSSVLELYLHCENIYLYVSDTNRGLAKSLNFLIGKILDSECNYKYIARMDSDDICHNDRISRQYDFMESFKGVDVLGTLCSEFGASFAKEVKYLPVKHDDLVDFSVTRCPFVHPTVMFRISLFTDGFRYPEDTVLTEDMAFGMCCFQTVRDCEFR